MLGPGQQAVDEALGRPDVARRPRGLGPPAGERGRLAARLDRRGVAAPCVDGIGRERLVGLEPQRLGDPGVAESVQGEVEGRLAEGEAGRLHRVDEFTPHRPELVRRRALQDRDADDREERAVGSDHARSPGRGHQLAQVDSREPRRRREGRARHREPDRERDEEVEEFPIEAIQPVAEPLQGRRRDGVGLAEAPVALGHREEHLIDEPRRSARELEHAIDLLVGRRILEQVGGAIANRGCREVPEHEVRALPAEPVDELGDRLRSRPRPEGDDDVRAVAAHQARQPGDVLVAEVFGVVDEEGDGCAVRPGPVDLVETAGDVDPAVTKGFGEPVEQRRLARASGTGDAGVDRCAVVEDLPHELRGLVPSDRPRNPPSDRRERPPHGTDGAGSVVSGAGSGVGSGEGLGSGTGSGDGSGTGSGAGSCTGSGTGLRRRIRHGLG